MATEIDLIYCAGGNPLLSKIAYEEGWLMGVRSDKGHTGGLPIAFIDVEYKSPDFELHLRRVAKERPKYATIPDLNEKTIDDNDIDRAIKQAERLKNYCEIPLIVPKLPGQISMLPAYLAIGYSIPTSYGGAQYPIWELVGRKVHLLGGSPQKQLEAYRYISSIGQVISVDGNMAQKCAIQFLKYWQKGKWIKWNNTEKNQYPHCWRQSCKNIYHMWQNEFSTNLQNVN